MSELSRRSALKLLSANIALIAAGCGKPPEEVLPYVHMPERVVPGEPLQFASTLPLGGYGRGVLCSSVQGRPIKVSGNPLHPASLGSTDVFAEAHVLSLYDPDRSRACRRNGEITAWEVVEGALAERLAVLNGTGGNGLRLLTGPLTSPTNLRQMGELRTRFPSMKWYVHDPLRNGAATDGAVLAYVKPLDVLPRLAEADIIVTLDADPLGPGPAQIILARGFADRRRVRRGSHAMARVYALESTPTVTGANADHRLTLSPDQITIAAIALARGLGAEGLPDVTVPPEAVPAVAAILLDLQAHRGRAVVLAGAAQPAEVHALAHWINGRLDAPVSVLQPVAQAADGTLADLVADLGAGRVDTLLISGCNPAYDAPGDLTFDQALLQRAKLTLQHGLYQDETGAITEFHVPDDHPLESWGDLRAVEGTASIIQPLVDRLYATRSLTGLLAGLAGQFATADYDSVRQTWQAQGGADFEAFWRKSVSDGLIAATAPAPVEPGAARLPAIAKAPASLSPTLVLRTDPSVYDGAFANNAWLQECPKPLTKEVWGNALGIGPADAARLGIADGDTIRLTAAGQQVLVPARIQAGHAANTMSLSLGYGRRQAGLIGTDVGVSAFPLRTAAAPWWIADVQVARSDSRHPSHSTQKQFVIDGDRDEIFPTLTVDALPARPLDAKAAPPPTLLPTHDYSEAFARWAMVIDTAACIGCNACVLACQVENNVPVVGPEEIDRNRDMHWLRIDAYDLGSDDGRTGFQPVPCMHCETAPCEPVCPVGASIHDSEGLNVQVYNRCVGTRFCEANCPYKVRRFNFFGYADGQEYKNLGAEIMHAHNNPDVSVRARGVMEKCTYCVQRISGARRQAEKEGRSLREGDVTTACQNACPTRAIAFGDLNDAHAEVSRLQDEPQHFTLLGKLNTKPRTTYLADVRNPNPSVTEVKG